LFDGNESYIRIVTTGNLNSDNKIESILDRIKTKGTELGIICEVNQGLRTGADKVAPKHIAEYGENRNYDLSDGIFILRKNEVDSLELLPSEKKRIKDLYKNSDIDKYIVNERTNLKLIDIFWPNDRNINLKDIS
jgi:adenine-specific DNA-methyltransferase